MPDPDAATTPERTFGWWDMFVHPDDDPRTDGGPFDDERDMFVAYLNDQRLTLQMKCCDLDAEQLARRSVEPSNLSLLGLLRHLAGVEQIWIRIRFAGEQASRHYRTEEDPNGDFNGAVADHGGGRGRVAEVAGGVRVHRPAGPRDLRPGRDRA